MNEGWKCPECKSINAPWLPQCPCSDAEEEEAWTRGLGPHGLGGIVINPGDTEDTPKLIQCPDCKTYYVEGNTHYCSGPKTDSIATCPACNPPYEGDTHVYTGSSS